MTDTTPDYAELIAEAEAAQEWMRQPDWADNFSLGDLEGWLRQRPTSILPRITSALSTLLERNAALERENAQLTALNRRLTLRNEVIEAKLVEKDKEIADLNKKFEILKRAYDRERQRPIQILGSNAGGNDGE